MHFQGIKIRNSGLRSVDSNAFANISTLQYLMLTDGLLTQPPYLGFICKSLILLDLQNNNIAHIDGLYFADCMKLRMLYLQGNLLSSMPDISYTLHTLTTLNLSRNRLSGTYLYFITCFRRLHTIYLELNHLTAFCMQQINYLPLLGFISLNNNNITYVKFDYLQGREQALILTLSNNPLRCDKVWNNNCGDATNYPINHVLCGDDLQILGIQCVNNTGKCDHTFCTFMYPSMYSISQEICTRCCCALLCCGYAIVHNEFTWSIYPYSSGLLCWHWGNR